ncbi:MAG TPA: hypothetical protein VK843_16695, partial [Planctomycetota bacterium]|nr:hypothetical protein [Planctomycetota bacterium]
VCAAISVVHIWRMAQAIPLGERLDRWRPAWVGLVLLGTLSNRTFLAWTSSGLETPLFVMLVIGWVDAMARRRYLSVTIHAALLALCRPDGLLLLAASLVLLLLDWRRVRPLALLPLLVVPIHLLWRHEVYGLWLPNTYYAKVTRSFVESGLRYVGLWMLEYAWWFLLGVGLVAAVLWIRRGKRWRLQAWQIAVAAVLANAAWYTLWLGGDHFEFRIYAHLVPLAWLGLLGILGALSASPRATAVILAAQLLLSLPIQWTHWALTHELITYQQARDLSVQVAPHLPRAMRPYAAAYDEMQAWLNSHLVCIRHQEHAVYAEFEIVMLPKRPPTQDVVDAWTHPVDIPTMAAGAVGAIGWALPQVAIIDFLGLNDAVVAWNPELAPGRRMSHERRAPAGYVESFRPNVTVRRAKLIIAPREDPLDPAEVEAIERLWWTRMGIAR